MNQKHLSEIFQHYIEKFEYINGPEHGEVYKWQIAHDFRTMMDEALAAPDEELSGKLYEIKKMTENLIDGYTQPFYGLCKFAEKDPETVRKMFLDLFQEDGGDLQEREKRIRTFLNESHALRDKYYENSYLYTDDFHSVTCYLAMYDPDHNYILKQTQSRRFAECVEWYQDWGSGEDVNLSIYYKMCDELVAAIKSDEGLMNTDASRFDPALGFGELYPDTEKHILAFDLIYCSTVYDLYTGISIVKRNPKERALYEERRKEAALRKERLDECTAKVELLNQGKAVLAKLLPVNSEVMHKTFGKGQVTSVEGSGIQIRFANGIEKKLGAIVVLNGLLSRTDGNSLEELQPYADVLKKENAIKTALAVAERQFAMYEEYYED